MLVLVFSVSCSIKESFQPKERKAGVGFRYGINGTIASFSIPNTNDNSSRLIEGHESINDPFTMRSPLFLQFNEDLLKGSPTSKFPGVTFPAYSLWYFDLASFKRSDIPPFLNHPENKNFSDLKNDSDGQAFIIKSSHTNIDAFSQKYPEYRSLINAASEPSISADADFNTISLGKNFGIFLPMGERNRLGNAYFGIGISYMEGYYDINLCDPYIVIVDEKSHTFPGISIPSIGQGSCNSKYRLERENISNFGISAAFSYIIYQYIGESSDFSFGQFEGHVSYPVLPKENKLTINFASAYLNIASIAIYF